jgi:hypothetical protein
MKSFLWTVSTGFIVTLQLGAAVAAASTDNPPTPGTIDAHVRKEVLDELARQLEFRYAIESTAKKLADLVRSKQKSNAYKKITSAPELGRALTNDRAAVAHDKHLRVYYSFTPVPKAPSGPPPAQFASLVRKLNGMIPRVEVLDGNVGYMRVNGVPPVDMARPSVVAAFAFLHNTDALIIDNRGNGGGDPETVALYSSYLSEGNPYVVNTFHWREGNRVVEFKTTDLGDLSYGAHKPVFVLTSPTTFSGGEELSYDLQVLKRAVIVGEVTGGGANPGGPVPLGHQFAVNMPSGQAVNPVTGTSWEGVGVKPDVAVPSAPALGKAHALAIERLTAEASDPASRSELNAIAMKLETIEEAKSGHPVHIANQDLIGTYALQSGPGATVTILENQGRLTQHTDGFPDTALTFLAGNRYTPEGLPVGYATSFRMKDGKVELLLEVPFGPPTIRSKQ